MKKKVKTTDPQEIYEKLSLYLDVEFLLSGTLLEISKNILNIKDIIKQLYSEEIYKKYFEFKLKFECWDNEYKIDIFGIRLETQEEIDTRIKKDIVLKKNIKEKQKEIAIQTELKEKELLDKLLKKIWKIKKIYGMN